MMMEGDVSKLGAVAACTFMTIFYVAMLYAPTAVLCLPPPASFTRFTIRRFFCAAVSTAASFAVSFFVLSIRSWDIPYLLGAYGIRRDHLWQAVVFPLFLTCLMYCGSLVSKFLLPKSLEECNARGESTSFHFTRICLGRFLGDVYSAASNIRAWRNYVVAPLTEELVFRGCMIRLLLSGGFQIYSIVFLCPVFFSLAHLNHLFEFFGQQNCRLLKAFTVVGLQLGYTAVFGVYASFLFIRTGHLLAPLVAHIFCNMMGLPLLFSPRSGLVAASFVSGAVAFLWLLFPLTRSELYNYAASDSTRSSNDF